MSYADLRKLRSSDDAVAMPIGVPILISYIKKLVATADASAAWYERFAEHMKRATRDFAWSYIQRSGRIDPDKLRKIAPKFVAG